MTRCPAGRQVIRMLANNNRKVIDRMAAGSLKHNRGRNLIIFLSIVLASFMLFSIFTVGITYFQMQKVQNIRLNGGEYDAVLYGITPEQREKCENDPDIRRAGILALSGYLESTQGDDTVEAACIWCDPVLWDEIMAPAREWVKGTYPQEEDQVMVTEEGLEKAGLAGLTVGDHFRAGYRDGDGNLMDKEFEISGIWEGYGTKSAFYVSEAFYRQSGSDISEVTCGRYHLDFDKKIMTKSEQDAFIESLDLGKQQALFFTSELGYSLPIFFGLCGLALVTCLCAYLLIYNILYLSVAGNVRYYGLLQTVGMTGLQIRRLIRRQMMILGCGGILCGLITGSLVSFLLFPSVIRALGIRAREAGEIQISLNPAAALSVFLCISTLLESQAARTIVTNHMNNDLTITNDSLRKEDPEDHRDVLTASFMEDLEHLDGVSAVYPLLYGQITVPWEPDFAEQWMEEFYAKWMMIPYEEDRSEYQQYPENFGSVILGISEEEFPYLQEVVDTTLDREDFLSGKSCVLYRNGLELTMENLAGTQVTCAEYGDSGNTRTFEIAGFTDEGYYTGPMLGDPPTIIVSESVVRDFLENPWICKAGVRYTQEYDEETESKVLGLIQNSPDGNALSWESKLETLHEVERAQGNMREVGLGIALVLAFIGILNYINTVTGNIQSRQRELAILESIGMTDRQRNRLLVTEGLFYAAGSLLLTATLGLGITYLVYQSMNYMMVPFTVPLWPVVGMTLFIVLVCIAIPLAAGRYMSGKGSVMERVRLS